MLISNQSCAVAFTRDRNNATSADSATGNATTKTQNSSKPTSLQELRAQLRAQLERNINNANLARLVARVLTADGWTDEKDIADAIEIAQGDDESALICFSDLAERYG